MNLQASGSETMAQGSGQGSARESGTAGRRAAGREPRRLRCAECGAPFETHRLDAKFCGDRCRHTDGNRMKMRGAVAARMLLEFRRHRGKGAASYSDLTNLGDKWVAEDNQRERLRKARIAAERAVEAGKVELRQPERLVIVGTANRRLGTVYLDRSANVLGWRMASDVLPAPAYLAPTPEAALGHDSVTGRARADDPNIRLFPAGSEPAEIDTRGK